MTLTEHLSKAYVARFAAGQEPDAHQAFVTGLVIDHRLADEARARLAELEALDAHCSGNLASRCIISAVHLDALRRALAG